MKKYSVSCHDGFISTYFLSILLYCSALLTVLTVNDQKRLQTVMNMKENDAYFIQEAVIISDIRCKLANDSLQEGSFTAGAYSYDLDLQQQRIYVLIHSDHPENLNIVWDPEEKVLLDLDSTRPYLKR